MKERVKIPQHCCYIKLSYKFSVELLITRKFSCKGTKHFRLRCVVRLITPCLSFRASTLIQSSCRTLTSSSTSLLETQVGGSRVFDGLNQRSFVDIPLPLLATRLSLGFVRRSNLLSTLLVVLLYNCTTCPVQVSMCLCSNFGRSTKIENFDRGSLIEHDSSRMITCNQLSNLM